MFKDKALQREVKVIAQRSGGFWWKALSEARTSLQPVRQL